MEYLVTICILSLLICVLMGVIVINIIKALLEGRDAEYWEEEE